MGPAVLARWPAVPARWSWRSAAETSRVLSRGLARVAGEDLDGRELRVLQAGLEVLRGQVHETDLGQSAAPAGQPNGHGLAVADRDTARLKGRTVQHAPSPTDDPPAVRDRPHMVGSADRGDTVPMAQQLRPGAVQRGRSGSPRPRTSGTTSNLVLSRGVMKACQARLTWT